MKKKYLYNGKYYTEEQMGDFASQSNLNLNDYIKELGGNVKSFDAPYEYNGKHFSEPEMNDFAKQSNLPLNDYLSEIGVKKKDAGTNGSQVGAMVGQLGSGVQSTSKSDDPAKDILDREHSRLTNVVNSNTQPFARDNTGHINALPHDVLVSQSNDFYNAQHAKKELDNGLEGTKSSIRNQIPFTNAADYVQQRAAKDNPNIDIQNTNPDELRNLPSFKDNTTANIMVDRWKRFKGFLDSMHGVTSLKDQAINFAAHNNPQLFKDINDSQKYYEQQQQKSRLHLDVESRAHPSPQLQGTKNDTPIINRNDALVGTAESELLNSPEANEFAQKVPAYRLTLQQHWNDLFNTYPTFGRKALEEYIGNYNEQHGKTNIWYEPGSHNEDAVKHGIDDGTLPPTALDFYNKHKSIISPPSPSTVNNVTHGILKGFENIGGLAPNGKTSEQKTSEALETQYTTPAFEPKGALHWWTTNASELTGELLPSAFLAAGIGEVPANIKNVLSIVSLMKKPNEEQAALKFRNDPAGQFWSTTLTTTLDAALGFVYDRSKILNLINKEAKPELNAIVKKFSDGEINEAAMKEAASGTLKKYLNSANDLALKTAKHNVQLGAQMGSFTMGHEIINNALQGNFNLDKSIMEGIKSGGQAMLMGTPIAALSAAGEKGTAQQIYDATKNYEKTRDDINTSIKLSDEQKTDLISKLDHSKNVLNDVSNNLDLTENQKKKYLLYSLNEKALQNKIETTTDSVLKDKYKEQIKVSKEARENIIGEKPIEQQPQKEEPITQQTNETPIQQTDTSNQQGNISTEEKKPVDETVNQNKQQSEERSKNADVARDILDEVSTDKSSSPLTLEEKDNIHSAINDYEKGNVSGEDLRKTMIENGVDEKYIGKKLIEKNVGEKVNETDKSKLISGTVNQNQQQPEVKSDFDHFKEQMLSELENRSKDKFDLKVKHELLPVEQKTIEQGIKNIREGKDTKAAKDVSDAIQKMYDDGVVHYEAKSGKTHTQQPQGVPISHFIDIAKESSKPIDVNNDDHLHELNTLLGEDAFPHVVKEENTNFINSKENATTSKDDTSKANLQQFAAGKTAENNQKTTGDEGATPPGQPNTAEPTATGNEGNTVGVSHESLTNLTKRLGLKEPERGEYLSPQWYAERGRMLLENGANPNEVNNPNNELHDRISIARAHLENLTKAADDIAKNNPDGVDSKEYQEAAQKVSDYANDVVKKLGTLAHRAFESLQGERDIDTDSFTAVKKAVQEKTGNATTQEQQQKIKKLTDKNIELKSKVESLEKKLIEATDKSIGEESPKSSIKEKAKAVADRLRKAAKLHRPDTFSSATPASIVWDSAVEVVAKTIEAGGTVADAIQNGITYMQKTEWYKKLSDDSNKKAEKEFAEWHNKEFEEPKDSLEKLQKQFVNKSDDIFTIDESKSIWDYAKKNYLDKGVSYRDMISNVSNDLGLSWRQVSHAITSKKVQPISDAMWAKQAEYKRNQVATKRWVAEQDKSSVGRLLSNISGSFRGVAVFGHGGIFVGTHAGMNLFKPTTWKYIIPAFLNGWKFAYGNEGKYARAIEELKNSSNYTLAQRSGLQNNPERINMEEYQRSQKFLGKLGLAGERGFNAIKILRQQLFDFHYNALSDAEKSDPQSAKSIAHLVNNATGATNVKIPKWVDEATFAGRMETARWEKLTSNPVKATSTAIKALLTPDKASVGERVFAKVWAKRVGEQLATMTGVLVANAAIQNVLNPNNPVNLTNPNKPDFLKLKFGDIEVDPTSGMRGAAMFAYGLGKIPFENQKQLRGDTRMQATGKSAAGYVRGKLAPLYSTMADFFTQQDYSRNPLPFSEDKPAKGHHTLLWLEYGWEKAPLPIAEAAQVFYKSAQEHGADKTTLDKVLDGIMTGVLSGGTGLRVSKSQTNEVESSGNSGTLKSSRSSHALK